MSTRLVISQCGEYWWTFVLSIFSQTGSHIISSWSKYNIRVLVKFRALHQILSLLIAHVILTAIVYDHKNVPHNRQFDWPCSLDIYSIIIIIIIIIVNYCFWSNIRNYYGNKKTANTQFYIKVIANTFIGHEPSNHSGWSSRLSAWILLPSWLETAFRSRWWRSGLFFIWVVSSDDAFFDCSIASSVSISPKIQ